MTVIYESPREFIDCLEEFSEGNYSATDRVYHAPSGDFRGEDTVSDYLCLGHESDDGYTRFIMVNKSNSGHVHLTSWDDYLCTNDDYDGPCDEMSEAELYRLLQSK